MDGQTTNRPFARIDIIEMRAALPDVSGGALKIWIAYVLRANHEGVAWPGTQLLATDTGMSASRASKLRNELIRDGWLEPAGCARGKRGMFGAPRLRPVIPQIHRAAKIAHGESTTRQEMDSPYGENDSHRAAKIAHEVDSKEVDSKEVERSAVALPAEVQQFENPKINDRIKTFLDQWSKCYRDRHASKPTISWPREMKRLRPIFEKNSDAAVENAAKAYLEDGSDFTVGHPIGILTAQFDRWRALGNSFEYETDDDCNMPTEDDIRPPDYEETMMKVMAEKEKKSA
jgi:hypothetical protein